MKTLVVYAILISTMVCAEYPPNLLRCSRTDEACFLKAAQEYTEKYYAGQPEINLHSFDPLYVKSMILKRNPSSPVNIEIKFTDIIFTGMKSMKMQSVKIPDLGGRFELVGIIPELTLKGNYSMNGRVLILPVVGNGFSVIKCKNSVFKLSFDLNPVQKNGQTHAGLEHTKLDVNNEMVQFHFDNLFNGDKALGDNMNEFINENWRDIFNEINPGFSKALSLELKNLIKNVLDTFPFTEYFL